jgi:hypothetical protein
MHENKTDENKALPFQELDHVFQSAQLRRSADLGLWLREYFGPPGSPGGGSKVIEYSHNASSTGGLARSRLYGFRRKCELLHT